MLNKEELKELSFYNNKIKLAHFLANCSHESMDFKVTTENLNYGVNGLLTIFPKYFSKLTALSYARNPEKIANKVYANRMGNGNEASGDGWKYRGRSYVQLTGKSNYIAFSKYVNDPDVITNPDIVANKYKMVAAAFFFESNNILSDIKDISLETIKKVRKRVNGGLIGIDEVVKLTNKFYIELTA